MICSVSLSVSRIAQASKSPGSSPKISKVPVYLKLDRDVVDWFQQGGSGYQARINEVLKRFVRAMELEDGDDRPPSTLEQAQELFERYYIRCFWHMKRDLIVTEAMLPAIINGLRTYGGREGYQEAGDLCR